MLGSTLQIVMMFVSLILHQTLSGRIQLEVGMLGGRMVVMSWLEIRSKRGEIISAKLKRCRFVAASQSRWCWLKSPNHSMWSLGEGSTLRGCLSKYVWRAVVVELLVQLL